MLPRNKMAVPDRVPENSLSKAIDNHLRLLVEDIHHFDFEAAASSFQQHLQSLRSKCSYLRSLDVLLFSPAVCRARYTALIARDMSPSRGWYPSSSMPLHDIYGTVKHRLPSIHEEEEGEEDEYSAPGRTETLSSEGDTEDRDAAWEVAMEKEFLAATMEVESDHRDGSRGNDEEEEEEERMDGYEGTRTLDADEEETDQTFNAHLRRYLPGNYHDTVCIDLRGPG
eukprot:gb/GECH01008205.1/.p1 GENE.gb/GECH01008205.1/~~gb/GECH01008205.1/.p1  ORF type:complete len:226 (+),score=46.58 gb/GECH01008205.1/:1-678(+)